MVIRCDSPRLHVDDAQVASARPRAPRPRGGWRKNDRPSIFTAGLWSMNGFQFFSDGSAIGAVTTRKFFAALLVVM